MKQEQKIIINEFISVCNVYVAIHDEEVHFSDNTIPQIKVNRTDKRIRANKLFTKLPQNIKEALVAHELGHLEENDTEIPNFFYRLGCVMQGKVDQRELDADLFACRKIGVEKYIDAMKEVLTLWKHSESGRKEIELRIKMIKGIN